MIDRLQNGLEVPSQPVIATVDLHHRLLGVPGGNLATCCPMP
jgi:hypothetical protein